jgi:MGT family glycosyltransferase
MTTTRNILFSFAGGRGHLNPLLPLARTAADRGHEISLTGRAAAGAATQTGFAHLHPDDTTTRRKGGAHVALGLDAPKAASTNDAALFFDDRALAKVARIRELSAVHGYEMIVCDELDFGAMLAAELLSIPVATVAVLAAEPVWLRPLAHDPMQALRASAGLGPDPELSRLRGDFMVVPFPASFRAIDDTYPSTLRVRAEAFEQVATHPAADWLAAGEERHRVYVTLGTEFNQDGGDVLARLLDALAQTGARVLVTSGPGVDPSEVAPLSDRVRVEAYVPQDAVMRVCDLAVLHGGSGSLTGAVLRGKPVVVVPLGADQFANALKAEDVGLGRAVDAGSATVSEISAVLQDVLTAPRYAQVAKAIQHEMHALPAMRSGWERLERLLPGL